VSPTVRDALAWRRAYRRSTGCFELWPPGLDIRHARQSGPGAIALMLSLTAYLPDPPLPLPDGGER